MKLFRLALLWLAFCCPTLAQVGQIPTYLQPPGAPAGYQGPGDVVSGAKMWWGLRAYSAADRGNRLVNACHVTGVTTDGCLDLVSDATTGNLVPAVVDSVHTCPGSGCQVNILYDRSGALNCAGAPCDLQAVGNTQAADLTASCISTRPCITWHTAITQPTKTATNNVGAIPQPITYSFVFNLLSAATTGDIMVCPNGSVFATTDTVPTWNMFAGTNFTVALSTSTWTSGQTVFNGSSSSISVNGSVTSGLAGGANSCAANDNFQVGWDSFEGTSSSTSEEYGVWGIAFNGTQQTNMTSNQRSYWGF